MLFIVAGVTVFALLALLVAIVFGSILAGWIAIGASAVGLLLLLVDRLRNYKGDDDHQNAGAGAYALPSTRLDVSPLDDRSPSVTTELTDGEVDLHPDIWPPDHTVHEAPGDDSRIEPRRAGEGESLHPDIWP